MRECATLMRHVGLRWTAQLHDPVAEVVQFVVQRVRHVQPTSVYLPRAGLCGTLLSRSEFAAHATALVSPPWLQELLSSYSITDGCGVRGEQYVMGFYSVFLVYAAFPPVLLTVTYLSYLFVLRLMIRKKR
jgi:hypothetical protein